MLRCVAIFHMAQLSLFDPMQMCVENGNCMGLAVMSYGSALMNYGHIYIQKSSHVFIAIRYVSNG